MVKIFSDVVGDVVNSLAPKRTIMIRAKRKVKLTRQTRNLMRERDKARKSNATEYKTLRNKCKGEVWKVVSDIMSPKMSGGQVVKNEDGGDLPEDEADHLFNEFFVEKIETLRGRIPDTPGTDPLLGRRKKMTEKKLEFKLRTVSVAEVKKIILRLKNS
jgi:hypothetical protein